MVSMNRLFFYGKNFSQGQMQISAGDIFQIAELSVIKSGEIREHVQMCDEITYVVSGKATVYSGDSCYEMTRGQIHYIKKGNSHKIVADDMHNFHYYCIGFQLNPEYKELQCFVDIMKNISHCVINDADRIQNIFEPLLNEFYIQDKENTIMINTYFCQLLISLYRLMSGSFSNPSLKLSTASASNVVYRTLKYIDREYLNISSVKDIAKALSYSEYYLSHVFKKKMDITIKEYLLQKKIITAAELLQMSNMSVSEISEQVGFSSPHSFSQAFKRHMNMSANEFRKKFNNQQ